MASRSTIYRQRLKDENPQKYQEYLDKQKAKSKEYREKLNKQLGKRHPNQNAINKKEQMLALQRERQKGTEKIRNRIEIEHYQNYK